MLYRGIDRATATTYSEICGKIELFASKQTGGKNRKIETFKDGRERGLSSTTTPSVRCRGEGGGARGRSGIKKG